MPAVHDHEDQSWAWRSAVANSTASFPLLAVPLFILLGCMQPRGIADRLFDFALALLGRVRGSLGYVSVGVSVGFSWMSGSASRTRLRSAS